MITDDQQSFIDRSGTTIRQQVIKRSSRRVLNRLLVLNIRHQETHTGSLSSPGVSEEVAAGEEKPPNEGVMLFPLVRPPRPLKPPLVPKPEKAGGVAPPPPPAAVRENPLNPLKAPLTSP